MDFSHQCLFEGFPYITTNPTITQWRNHCRYRAMTYRTHPPVKPWHPGSRGPLRKLGQKLKRGSQIEPYRLFHSFNGLPFTILIHFRSDKARRKPFGGPFLVLVSNFLKILVWNPIALASGCAGEGSGAQWTKELPHCNALLKV